MTPSHMSLSFEDLYHEVAQDYKAAWNFKFRGATLEIITPHSTISDKFVSVFLTQRGDSIIVSDGGYLHTGEYIENEFVQQDRCYSKTVDALETYYNLLRVIDTQDKVIFYLKTNKREMISSLVHDVASFVTGVVNAQQITLENDKEAVTRERFAKQAGGFLLDAFQGRKIKFGQPLRERIHFSAGIWKGSKVSLVQFITGSDPYHFANSMAKATMNFLAVKGSSLEPSVTNKVSLIDTTASGFRSGGNSSYTKLLGEASDILSWEERNKIVTLVGQSN